MNGRPLFAPNPDSGVWHAYRPGASRAVCGFRRLEATPQFRAEGHVCRTCKRLLGWRDPRPVPHEPEAQLCACPRCRERRRAGVEEYVQGLRRSLERTFPARILDWPDAPSVVAAAEARLGALLLAWEVDGTPRALLKGDLADLERELFQAWREAERRHDLLGGPRAR